MKFPRTSILTAALVLIAGGAIWYSKTHPGSFASLTSLVDKTDSIPVGQPLPENPDDVPWQLAQWIDASLAESGLWNLRESFLATDASQRTRLRKDSSGSVPRWIIDFTDLPISVLGSGSEEDWTDFDIQVDVRGSRLCGEAALRITKFVRARATGIEEGSCSPAADRGLVESWFQENFQRDPSKTEISGPPGARPTALRLRCSEGDSLHDLARLRTASPDTLEIEGCVLGSTEQLGMQKLSVERVVLRDLPEELFRLDGFRNAKEIEVDGGNAMSIEIAKSCPEGNPECEWAEQRLKPGLSMKVSRIPLCDPRLAEELVSAGVVLENTRCTDYPNELAAMRKRIDDDWKALVGENLADRLNDSYDSISPDSVPNIAVEDTIYQDAVRWISWNSCDAPSYPEGFSPLHIVYGEDWVEGFGETFYSQRAIEAVSRKRLRQGMTRQELIRIFGRPSLQQGGFLAWGVHGECSESPVGLRAHFDASGSLDALITDYGHDCDDC